MPPPTKTLKQRFLEKIVVRNDGCHYFSRTQDGKYGTIISNRKILYAHRVSYELFIGQIPPGLDVCHHCDVKGCVNPKHLFLGTAHDNAMDMVRKGKHPMHQRTHCIHGHPLIAENLVKCMLKNGERKCRLCHKKNVANYRERLRLLMVEKEAERLRGMIG